MKVSIITINYNNAGGFLKTIQSVITQNYSELEFIIIDGGSSEENIEVIQEYKEDIDYWVSEGDRGIYHAMNKGIKIAKGDYLLFLNSGDILCSTDILSKVFEIESEEDLIYGDLIVQGKERRWIKAYPEKLTFGYFYRDTLPHPATFIKRELFEKVGKYNEGNKIVSDWEFFIVAVNIFNCSYKHLSFPISEFSFDGLSSLPESAAIIKEEKDSILKQHFPCFVDDYAELTRLQMENKTLKNSRALRLSHFIRGLLNI